MRFFFPVAELRSGPKLLPDHRAALLVPDALRELGAPVFEIGGNGSLRFVIARVAAGVHAAITTIAGLVRAVIIPAVLPRALLLFQFEHFRRRPSPLGFGFATDRSIRFRRRIQHHFHD